MNRLAAFVIVLAIIIIGVGLYRGWFVVSSTGGSQSEKVNVNLTVDQAKMKQDGAELKKEASELTGQSKK